MLASPAGSQPHPRWAQGGTIGTLQIGHPHVQASRQNKEQNMHPCAAMCPTAPDPASLLRWAPTLPRVQRL
jgi:hypothetical protein